MDWGTNKICGLCKKESKTLQHFRECEAMEEEPRTPTELLDDAGGEVFG